MLIDSDIEKTYKVYCLTNKSNGKKYIGMSGKKNIEYRWAHGKGYRLNDDLWRDIEEYGWNGFIHEVLFDNLTKKEAGIKETELIISLHTSDPSYGYNRSIGYGPTGTHKSKEVRKQISDKMKQYKITDEHRKHLSESKSGEKHHFAKKVYQYTKKKIFIREWSYMSEAALTLNIKKTSISATCKGKRPSAGGYYWSYERM